LTAPAQTFDAASIKLADPVSPESSMHWGPGQLHIRGMSLKGLILSAYDVKPYQVLGGPKWLDTDRYDIVAKMEAPARGRDGQPRIQAALRSLLSERFRLRVHEGNKTTAGYALVVAKSGLRIRPVAGPAANGSGYGPSMANVKAASMDTIASVFAGVLSQPVVNRTGLDGAYDFRIEFSPEGAPEAAAASEKPSIFTVVQESLGLKLEARKVPMRVVVVDRAEKPEEN
jgi:uncharacterized protein (TIGR03435 family)